MTRRFKRPTYTSIVEARMRELDDFVKASELAKDTGLTPNAVSAVLHHLLIHRAAEFVEGLGAIWWFLTPDSDTRTKRVEERTLETKPRKRRKSPRAAKQENPK